ncbi:acylneuraminate cytidylyltransferase family protein [Ferdinandcohnia sp. Marseille-Q9671]
MKKVNALVPMKGHSERVPSKNIRSFAGEPLFYKILSTLTECNNINDVYIDTDSELIANLALEKYDVKIIERPAKLIGDFVSMNDIIKYDISQIQGEYFIQTHSTNPLLESKTVDGAIEYFFKSEFDSLFSVTRLQTRLYFEDFSAINHNPEELLRTQDLPPVYEENSNFYIFSRDAFNQKNTRIGINPGMFEVPKFEAQDIDEEFDFLVAESLYKLKNKLKVGV